MPRHQNQIRSTVLFVILLLFTITNSFSEPVPADLQIQDLKCESRSTPIGVDAREPLLSWTLTSDKRGEYQTAYRILASSSLTKLENNIADLWDSSRVQSSNSINIAYTGKSLSSGQRVYWKVCVWDRFGNPTTYSPASWWEMGMLHPNDWQARWITRSPSMEADTNGEAPAPLLRDEF